MNKELSLSDSKAKAEAIFENLDVLETTRRDYAYRIDAFLLFIRERGMHRNSFLDFKKYLAARHDLSVATKNKNLAVARVFLREMNRLGYIPTDISQGIKCFSQSRTHKKEGLSQEEVEKIVAKLNSLPDTPRNDRLRALFCLLALQGLRQIEIVRLNAEDVNLVSRTALVQGKGRDDKEIIHLHPNAIEVLRGYIASNKIRTGGFFKGIGRRKSNRLSTRTIKREMGYLFEELKIEKTVHGMRHFYVSTLLSNKLDPRVVMKFSRHAAIGSVLIYDDERDLADRSKDVFECFEGIRIL